MKRFGKALLQRLREILFMFVSFPISVILFALVLLGLNSATFIPLSLLIFLFVLSVMEHVARFEIKRTNKILGTDFRIVDDWFGSSFFSWDGVKERITSLRVWMAVAYVLVAFGWSLFSFVLLVLGLSGLVVGIFSIGIATLSTFSRSFEVIDNGEIFEGSISFDSATGRIRLQLGDAPDNGFINWDLFSNWVLVIAVVLAVLALWIIPRNARAMAQVTEGLLSGTYLPAFERQLLKLKQRSKVSEREIREAMDKETLRPQLAELSKRELEILALMAQGKSNAGIAKVLYITEGAVEKHVSNILHKLGLDVEAENHRRVLAVLKYLGIESKDEKVGQ